MRNTVIRESTALLQSVKQLEAEKTEIKKQVADAQAVSDAQKKEATLLSFLMQLAELPELSQTAPRLEELKRLIQEEKNKQSALKIESQKIQKLINSNLAKQARQNERDLLQTNIEKLENQFTEEQRKESDLKMQQTKLSSDLLKGQISRRTYEKKLLEEIEDAPDLDALKKKKRSISEQVRLIKNKEEAFAQEKAATDQDLAEARSKNENLQRLEKQSASCDANAAREAVLKAASENLFLRRYRPMTEGAQRLGEYDELIAECEDLILRANAELDSSPNDESHF